MEVELLDLGNGLFEAVGALFVWANFFKLKRDRSVQGVHWQTTAFYAFRGAWNVLYYPTLGQPYSAAAGVVLCLGNFAWVVLALIVIAQKKRARANYRKVQVQV